MIKRLTKSVQKSEWKLFALMFAIVSLLNINFNILRSARNALVVASEGGSAALIPYFELYGTFPASILMTWGISRLMRHHSFKSIFSMSMGFFLAFFVFFTFWVHPHRELVQSFLGLHAPDLTFYILSELWKVALLSVIFWGFINQYLSMDVAKRFYPPLMLGSSVGAILAGPITVFCTSENTFQLFSLSVERWQHSLIMLTISMVLCGALTLYAFHLLHEKLGQKEIHEEEEKVPFKRRLLSLSSSVRYLLRSRYLMALLFIVLAEYISYALGELIFFETLKEKFPSRVDYCQYLGTLTFWTGILTAFSAIFITPYLLHKFKWSYSALLTPVVMVLLTFVFFAAIYMGKVGLLPGVSPLPFIVLLGSMHFCIGRSIKYTVFDTTKELAFIPLTQEGQMKGKLVIDGIGSRLGRGSSSLVSIGLFSLVGAPGESAIFAGIIATCFALLSIPAARIISGKLEGAQTI
ncbi:MAG: Npt1/Npt2 family nucleotide transporter [Simkaniaceae bacterium]|nr:Npt1/Npt2 family nucleotide transporter [Candidatus Sacchlamyda saccharinae]